MNNSTLDKMGKMRLFGMKNAFQDALKAGAISYTPDELIAYLTDAEYDDRANRKIQQLVKAAKFRYKASLENINYQANRNMDKNLIQRLRDCQFIQKAHNVIITGSTGVGKSYIASAIGYQACALEYKVAYFNLNKLFAQLKMAKADGTYLKKIARIEKQDFIILDDFGLKPFDNNKRHFLLDIMEDRYGKSATLIATQIPVSKWHELIGEGTVADAILDRIVHQAHRIELMGESLRRKKQF